MYSKSVSFITALFLYVSLYAQTSAENMLENVLSSVVSVGVFKAEGTNQILGFRGNNDLAYQRMLDMSDAYSKGSGYVIEVNGKKYVCTNAHVVQSAKTEAGSIYIFSINQTKYEVKLKGGDSFYDYAILEFVTPPGSEITAVKYTNQEPKVGAKVFAIGNPLAEYPYTVSDGIVSAKNRVRDGVTGKYGFIQSTATIIWGNSGGPLINEAGEVVGMNSQIAFGPEERGSLWQPQINFALDAAVCKRLTDDIINNNGRIRRAYFGLEISQNYKAEMDYMTMKTVIKKQDEKPVISAAFSGGPASSLSNKVGYAVTKVNDTEVRNMEEVLGEFEKIKPNTRVTLSLAKDGKTENASFTATELKPEMMNDLATKMIEQDGNYKLVAGNSGEVMISFKPTYTNTTNNGNRYDQNRRPDRSEREGSGGSANTTQQVKVMGVGYVDQNGSDVWRVNSLTDLGAGIRFYGLAGVYDLVVKDPIGSGQPQSARVYISGDKNVLKRTLWY